MATNVTEKDKTLQEVIDWAKSRCHEAGLSRFDVRRKSDRDFYDGQVNAFHEILELCRSMLGDTGSMPSEVPNQSEDTNVKGSKPMNNDQGQAVWRESIEKYGKETQSIVCMEECSELIQAVSKRLRGKPDATDNLAEEMADVTICLYLLKEMYGITDERLDEWIMRKTARQSKRMQADDPFMESEGTEMNAAETDKRTLPMADTHYAVTIRRIYDAHTDMLKGYKLILWEVQGTAPIAVAARDYPTGMLDPIPQQTLDDATHSHAYSNAGTQGTTKRRCGMSIMLDEVEAVAKRLCWDSCEWDGVDSYAAKDEDDAWDYAGEIPGFHEEYIRQAKEMLEAERKAVNE